MCKDDLAGKEEWHFRQLMIVAQKTLWSSWIKWDSWSKCPWWLRLWVSFYIKREHDTSSKATHELKRSILRGSLEIYVYDFVIYDGPTLCTSWGSIDLSPKGWKDYY